MTTQQTTPQDVYLHLLLIITLIISVVSSTNLIFQYVNTLLPDPSGVSGGVDWGTIQWSSASLLVALPVFLWLSRLLEKIFAADSQRRNVVIRKWLVYLLLLVAAITIIITLIQVVGAFFGGELTTQFTLKAAWVLAVAAAIFGYYRWDLHRDGTTTTNRPKIIGVISGIIGLAAIVAGFFIIGTPAEQRQYRLDEERVNDLQAIQNDILYTYHSAEEALPPDSDTLAQLLNYPLPTDPVTNQPYQYTLVDEKTFQLCADFAAATPDSDRNQYNYYRPVPVGESPNNWNWDHPAGNHCFTRIVEAKSKE